MKITVQSQDPGVDKFGIKKIYPTKSVGGKTEEWYMNMDNPTNDARTSPPSMTKNSDGSWKVTSGQVRYGVYTSTGYHPGQISTLNQAQMEAKGYMQSPNDWKNVEMTGIVKFVSGDSTDSGLGTQEEVDTQEVVILKVVRERHTKSICFIMERSDSQKSSGM